MPRGAREWIPFVVSAAAALGLAAAARASDPLLFRRFIGSANPVLVAAAAAVLGALLLRVHRSRGWFAIHREGNVRGLLLAVGLATLFGAAVIVADFVIVYPRGLNVAFPRSLLFYPVVAFVFEIVFHLLPVTLLLAVLGSVLKNVDFGRIAWASIVVVAALEPTYQAASAGAAGWAATAYTWLHVFAINLAELWLFRRWDFVSMLSLRATYYAIWHIAWGHYRLGVLF